MVNFVIFKKKVIEVTTLHILTMFFRMSLISRLHTEKMNINDFWAFPSCFSSLNRPTYFFRQLPKDLEFMWEFSSDLLFFHLISSPRKLKFCSWNWYAKNAYQFWTSNDSCGSGKWTKVDSDDSFLFWFFFPDLLIF